MIEASQLDPFEATRAVLEELKRRRSEGETSLYLEDSTLLSLQRALLAQGGALEQEQVIGNESDSDQTDFPPELSSSTPPRTEPSASVGRFPDPPCLQLPKDGSKAKRWEWLRERVLSCQVCNEQLNPGGKIVFGTGSLDADLFFCGEAPGAEEEAKGTPFVGPAGELLDRIISAMGLMREAVYTGNVVNFRPRHERAFGNRPPTPEEMNFCLPYLRAQLEVVQPKVIVALGKTATDGLLGHDPNRRLGQMRGNWHDYSDIPMMVTYHPSYLLHNPSKSSKRKVWEDMLMVMERLELPISEKQRGFFQ